MVNLPGEWTFLPYGNAKRMEGKHFTNRGLVHRTEETAREGQLPPGAQGTVPRTKV